MLASLLSLIAKGLN